MFEIHYSDILTFISFFSYTHTCLVLTTTSPYFINFNVYSFHLSTQWLKLKPSTIKILFCIKSYAMNFNNLHFLTNCSIWYVSLVLVGVILIWTDSYTNWKKKNFHPFCLNCSCQKYDFNLQTITKIYLYAEE